MQAIDATPYSESGANKAENVVSGTPHFLFVFYDCRTPALSYSLLCKAGALNSSNKIQNRLRISLRCQKVSPTASSFPNEDPFNLDFFKGASYSLICRFCMVRLSSRMLLPTLPFSQGMLRLFNSESMGLIFDEISFWISQKQSASSCGHLGLTRRLCSK